MLKSKRVNYLFIFKEIGNATPSVDGQKDYVAEYQGNLRINCDKFTSLIHRKVNNGLCGSYIGNDWQSITN